MGNWTIVVEGTGLVGTPPNVPITSKEATEQLKLFLVQLKNAGQVVNHATITYPTRIVQL